MKFGPVPVEEAVGALAAHSVKAGEASVKKGTLVSGEDAARLKAAGIDTIVAVRLEPGDVDENEAAARLAGAIAGPDVRLDRAFTGRCNLFAETPGVLLVDKDAVDRINAVNEAITAATLPAYKPVVAGEMIGTVKIIPYAVPATSLDGAVAAAPQGGALRVAPYALSRVGVVSTVLPGLKPTVVKKTLEVLAARLAPAGARIVADRRVPHDAKALTDELRRFGPDETDLIVVFGASAVADRRDVIPSAIEAAGGRIEHFGMPVDPGNLLLIGTLDGKPIIGAPGCARSPKENGFDWVLQRLLAGLPVTRRDIAGLGVGGLLMEIVTRPQPRDEPVAQAGHRVAAIVLAAGSSRRMGSVNKLLAEVDGTPLVRSAAEAAVASRAASVVVVTGHEADRVEDAVSGLEVAVVHNANHKGGLSTSLRVGLAAVPADADGVVVLLGDMPSITPEMVDRVIAAWRPDAIVVSTSGGKRGNPVLWPRRFFPDLMAVTGDTGGRSIIEANRASVVEVELGEAAALDIDTPGDLAEARGAVSA